MSRRLLRSALGLRGRLALAPAVLPIPATRRSFNATSQIVEPTQPSPDESIHQNTSPFQKPTDASTANQHGASRAPSSVQTAQAHAPTQPLILSDSVRALLPHLAAQPAQYIRIHIHGFPYLVTAGDQVRLPFKMPGVLPGDVLRLNRASILGSRDFTLQGGRINAAGLPGQGQVDGGDVPGESVTPAPGTKRSGGGGSVLKQPAYIDERVFECRAVVLGTESEPMRLKIKKKRRNRRTKTVRSKHRYTILRVSEIKINRLEELEA